MKDWTGNSKSTYSTLGASNHSDYDREKNDFYATPDIATEKLLEVEKFSNVIWECACGKGNISNVLKSRGGYEVINTDLIDRQWKDQDMCLDFINGNIQSQLIGKDIVTNPPYKYAIEFVKRGCSYLRKGNKLALLLKIQFLEGQERKKLFKEYPPERIYVFSKRITCAMNCDFEKFSESGAIAYAWYVWTYENNQKKNPPKIYWI